MFGHQDDQSDQKDAHDAPHEPQHDTVNADVGDHSQAAPQEPQEDPAVIITPDPAPGSGTTADSPADNEADEAQAEPTPAEPISDVISPAGGFPKPMTFRAGADDDEDVSATPVPSLGSDDNTSSTHELIDIKQKVLGELSPLIDDLDLNPEDKFRTIMMMIQASDDQTLVAKAYAAAHTIEDEKTRAQALLDIVNEINYFTTPHENQS
ncbi:hypothetical protein COY17_03180 [Candidatus Saccharibacteria bacterium CG_4_10_14_0_2_um_filter_52_9]|nr:MAG: hypothetical protein COY17_03180 [Candidatus Saccharibacteria bacterium CG_4_10_14_0_2_um_filter_52_9]